MPAISVIVPVYNTERYLGECLGSLLGQTFVDIEIICIDDASTDDSLEELQKIAAVDSRVRVVHSESNRGVSVSRNMGIAMATGEYLSFVDSDDRVEPQFYERLYASAAQGGYDIVKGRVRSFNPHTGEISSAWYAMDVDDLIRTNKAYFLYGFTSAIFRRSYVLENCILFPEGLILNEDPPFTAKAVLLTEKIGYVSSAIYLYTSNAGSATHNDRTLSHVVAQIAGCHVVLDLLNEHCDDDRHYAITSMLLLDHLLNWCNRGDVSMEITKLAAEGLNSFLRKNRMPAEIFTRLSVFRQKIEMKRRVSELRNRMKVHA